MTPSNISLLLAVFLGVAISSPNAFSDEHGHGDSHEDHHEEKGPYGGRLLESDNLTLEVTIFEKGVPPEFRIYPTVNGKAVSPAEVSLSVELTRFRSTERFTFQPKGEFLQSTAEVGEPHSFKVTVKGSYQGKGSSWEYDSFEGRTTIDGAALKDGGVQISEVGPVTLTEELRMYGQLRPNSDRVLHISPRFPGVIREVKSRLGDRVQAGDTLAVIESDQSLARYEVKTVLNGVVTERHAALGEHVTEDDELFIVSDLSEIWADFQLFQGREVTVGKSVTVNIDNTLIPGTVTYLSPYTDRTDQSRLVRVTLPNPQGLLRPGLFITGTVITSEHPVPLAVTRDAIQSFRDWDVVFETDGTVFQATPVTLGRQDGKHVEILSGLTAGARYVSAGSFLIKADIEKSGASHDH